MMYGKANIKYSKDLLQEVIDSAYKDLWDLKKPISLKIEALDLLSKYINHTGVKDRLEYFYEKETSRVLKKIMNRILSNEYESYEDSEDELYNSSKAHSVNKESNIDFKKEITNKVNLYKFIYKN